MSDHEKQEHASATPFETEEEHAAAVPVRRGKRRNCMVIPGTSDPKVAKLFSDIMLKEIYGSVEAVAENPEEKIEQ